MNEIAQRTDGPAGIEPASVEPVRTWLFVLAAMVALMVIVGGATRLTDSGLSITEWQPILGAIPPLTDADWQSAFAKYREIPEYKLVNEGMSLAEFKFIYWWEWGHRLLGRLVGFVFLLPFLYFWFTGRLSRPMIPKLVLLFVLGGLQGALGWYMVKSGLVDRVDVSQYRLAAHLGLAVLIFGAILWVAFGLGAPRSSGSANRGLYRSAIGLSALIFFQILLGALVAGIHAGRIHNTWPLMDGALVPDGLFIMSPWYLNLFENALTVQFDHRLGAYAIVIWVAWHTVTVIRQAGEGPLAVSAGLLVLAVLAQVGLGIWTLLAQVPIDLALLHQGAAVLLFGFALWHTFQLSRPAV